MQILDKIQLFHVLPIDGSATFKMLYCKARERACLISARHQSSLISCFQGNLGNISPPSRYYTHMIFDFAQVADIHLVAVNQCLHTDANYRVSCSDSYEIRSFRQLQRCRWRRMKYECCILLCVHMPDHQSRIRTFPPPQCSRSANPSR